MKLRNLLLACGFLAACHVSTSLADDVAAKPLDSLSQDQLEQLEQSKESMNFQTEVARMLDIIINSLYTQREVFMRELISNAADALEKARYLSISDKDFLADQPDLALYIEHDVDAKTISITDTGVGMSRSDLINNLGTLAKSGTTNFLEAAAGGSDLSLIGQFGVGFYSSFLVADKVTVISKKPGDDQYIWESSADAQFTVAKDPRGNTLGRGTRIILHLKDDATEFASEKKLEELAKRYSEYIAYPIYLTKKHTVEKEVDDVDAEMNEDGEFPKKTVKEEVAEPVHINTQKAIWLRSKDDVTDEEYHSFYSALSKDTEAPLAHTHFAAEGDVEFRALLYVPPKSSRTLFDDYHSQKSQLKLYVRRVLVQEGVEDLLPKYLHFMIGVVDSDDLPLNVSREQFQQDRVLKTISKAVVKRTFDMLTRLSKDEIEASATVLPEDADDDVKAAHELAQKEGKKYLSFYKEYSKALKMGCFEDDANRNRILKLLRFNTLQHNSEKSSSAKDFSGITLDQYLDNMPENQNEVYYMSGDSIAQLLKAPHLQAFRKRGLDVLLLTESLDEPCLQKATEYGGKKLVNVQKGDIKFDETDEDKARHKKLVKAYKPLTAWWKKQLEGKVGKVEISKRLVEDPVTVVASQWGYSSQMERIMKAQAFADPMQLQMMMGFRTLEINPDHPLIKDLLRKVELAVAEATEAAENATEEEGEEKSQKKKKVDAENVTLSAETTETAKMLYEAALMGAGFDVDQPSEAASRIYKLLSKELGVDPGAAVEEFDVSAMPEDSEEADGGNMGGGEFNFDDANFDFDEEDVAKDEEEAAAAGGERDEL